MTPVIRRALRWLKASGRERPDGCALPNSSPVTPPTTVAAASSPSSQDEPEPTPQVDPAPSSNPSNPLAGALTDLTTEGPHHPDLAQVGTEELARELRRRHQAAEPGPSVRLDAFGALMPGHPGIRVELPPAGFPGGGITPILAMELRRRAEAIIDNRFGRAYFQWAFATFPGDGVEGKVCVDLGCGSQNPLALSMLYLLLGAGRTLAVDIDPPQDERYVAWGVAEVASMMASDPRLLVESWPVSRADVAARLDGFDMVELWEGRTSGLDSDRVALVQTSADDLPLDRHEADLVFSTSFFEHVEDIDAVIEELARVVKPGGWTWHLIDGHDHRSFTDPSTPPLRFLSEPADLPMVYGCNRMRPLEYVDRFEKHGFTSVARYPLLSIPVDDAERATFVEPWRSMPEELLAVRGAVLAFQAR